MPKQRVAIRKCQKEEKITYGSVTIPVYNSGNEIVNRSNKYPARDPRALMTSSKETYADVSGWTVFMALRMPNGEFGDKFVVEIVTTQSNDYVVVLFDDDGVYYAVDAKIAKFWEIDTKIE